MIEEKAILERAGIEIIPERERTAKPHELFLPWFAANISVFGMSYGTWVLGMGISFAQATIVSVLGIVISFVLCGVVAIAGKRGSAPTMVLARAAFGVQGQKIPGIISWLVSIGWETMLSILAVLATATVFERLGVGGGTATKVIATLFVAALIIAASVLGYHTIMRMQTVLTWLTGAITLLFIILTVPHIDFDKVASIPAGTPQQTIGAFVMVVTGFGLGWINIAADWSRYQSRRAKGSAIVFWNAAGGAAAPVVLVIFGLLLAGSDTQLLLIPFWITAILGLISGAVLGIYSSGLSLLSLGIKIARPAAAAVDGLLLTLGTVYVVFFAPNFIEPFQSFLITLGVPLAAWAGIMIADIKLRKQNYNEHALFDARLRYGRYDWVSVITFAAVTVIGWGLVVNPYAQSASWNNWQGYLLHPLGLGAYNPEGYWDGDWAYSNLGVLLALAFGFLITLLRSPSAF